MHCKICFTYLSIFASYVSLYHFRRSFLGANFMKEGLGFLLLPGTMGTMIPVSFSLFVIYPVCGFLLRVLERGKRQVD
jgi:hypothetical protein